MSSNANSISKKVHMYVPCNKKDNTILTLIGLYSAIASITITFAVSKIAPNSVNSAETRHGIVIEAPRAIDDIIIIKFGIVLNFKISKQ